MCGFARAGAGVALGASVAVLPIARAQAGDFAGRIVQYAPAPGQFVNDSAFNDPARALGPPVGGGILNGNNTGTVTLGGFGGTLTLAFDRPVRDDPRNPFGMDAIVFGNAFWPSGDANRRWAEPATIEISRDENGNGLADDAWFIVPGSHAPTPPLPPSAGFATRTWDDNVSDPANPPALASWVPAGRTGVWTTSALLLTQEVFGVAVVANPNGPGAITEGVFGYADLSPVLLPGDMNADDVVDEPGIDPAVFYTNPDDPLAVGVTPGSGGGDAFDIAWAVDADTGEPANLDRFDFLRLTNAVDAIIGPIGERSAEIDAAADVRPALSADWDASGGEADVFDLLAYLDDWFGAADAADVTFDGGVDVFDLLGFLDLWFAA
jgi:hypothetical protein